MNYLVMIVVVEGIYCQRLVQLCNFHFGLILLRYLYSLAKDHGHESFSPQIIVLKVNSLSLNRDRIVMNYRAEIWLFYEEKNEYRTPIPFGTRMIWINLHRSRRKYLHF